MLQLVAHGEPSDVIELNTGLRTGSWPGACSHLDGAISKTVREEAADAVDTSRRRTKRMNTRTAVHTDKESPFAPNSLGDGGKNDAIIPWNVPLSLQRLTERLRGLPRLFVADMSLAYGGADIFVAEEFLDFPQILSHVVKEGVI